MADESAGETRPARALGRGVAARGDEKPWDASGVIRGTVDELEQMLDAKHVASEPMIFGKTTVVPLVSMGFAFAAGGGGGGGTSPDGQGGEGGGGGGAGGGGVKPIAVLVIEDGAVRLERIPEPPSGLDKLGAAVAEVLDRRREKSSAKADD